MNEDKGREMNGGSKRLRMKDVFEVFEDGFEVFEDIW